MTPRQFTALWIVVLVTLGACNENSPTKPPSTDEMCPLSNCTTPSNDTAEPVTITPPTAPAPPTAPTLPEPPRLEHWICPEGWLERPAPLSDNERDAVGDLTICDTALPESCPAGTMMLPGQAQCVPVGSPCPEDDPWPTDQELRERAGPGFAQGNILYVADGARGNGLSRTSALGSIRDAMDQVSDGDIVAVGVGQYDENVSIQHSIAIVGACASETTLASPPNAQANATLYTWRASDVMVRDIALTGNRVGVWLNEPRGPITLSGVVIEGAQSSGLNITDGTPDVILDGVAIRNTRENPLDFGGGFGVSSSSSTGRITVMRSWIDNNQTAGISMIDGIGLVATDTAITRTQPNGDGLFGSGLWVQNGSFAHLQRLIVEHNHTTGILAADNTTIDADMIVVRDTQLEPSSGVLGHGLEVKLNSQVDMRQAVFSRNHHRGILSEGTDTVIRISDCVVEETLPSAPGSEYIHQGIAVLLGSRLEASRCVWAHNQDTGIAVEGQFSTATLEDVLVLDTKHNADVNDYGRGAIVQLDAELHITRGLFARNHDTNVFASDNARLTFEDAIIEDGLILPDNFGSGRGLNVQRGAELILKRALIRNAHDSGLFVGGIQTTATIEDITVTGTRAHGGFTAGIHIQNRVQVELRRVQLANNEGSELFVGPYATVIVEDLHALETQQQNAIGINTIGDNIVLKRAQVDAGHYIGLLSGDDPQQSESTTTVVAEDLVIQNAVLGITLASGSITNITRVRSEKHALTGLLIFDSGVANITDASFVQGTSIQDTGSIPIGHFGRGVELFLGGQLTLERALVEGNHEAGFHLSNAGTKTILKNVAVRQTLMSVCAPNCLYADLPGAFFGSGMIIRDGASVDAEQFEVSGSELVGVHLFKSGTSAFRNGEIYDNTIGINFDGNADELDKLFTEVELYNNDLNIDIDEVPAPSSGALLDALRDNITASGDEDMLDE